jgi:large subunit ribosomal protein L14
MLISKSKLNVKDNSGILVAQCIQPQRSKKSQKACRIGDFMKATIKKGSVKSSSLRLKNITGSDRLKNLVVIQTKKALRRLDGSVLKFPSNSGVTINERRMPLFKRVAGAVPLELKKSCGSVLNIARIII